MPVKAIERLNISYVSELLRGCGFSQVRSLRIEPHYTDTAGFTDRVFGLMQLLGFRFAPRIRDLGVTKRFIPKGDASYDALKPLISSDKLNIKAIRDHWDDILRLATSIK